MSEESVAKIAAEHLGRAWDEVSALRERVAQLEAALAPFASAGIVWASVPEDDVVITHFSRGKITVGDLRRAARALHNKEQKP